MWRWPSYIGEKGRSVGKPYGIKWGAIGNTLEEHVVNSRNNFENTLETWWEHKNKMKVHAHTPNSLPKLYDEGSLFWMESVFQENESFE
jgi:hypothetical protein